MDINGSLEIDDLNHHLDAMQSQMRLDQYGLDAFPPEEWQCHRSVLSNNERSTIVFAGNFKYATQGRFKLTGILPVPILLEEKTEDERNEHRAMRLRRTAGLDLTVSGNEIVLIGQDLHEGPLFILDGTHRLINYHHANGENIEGVLAHICIHEELNKWAWWNGITRHHAL